MFVSAFVTVAIGIIALLLQCWWYNGRLLLTLDDRRLEGQIYDLVLAAFIVFLLGPTLTLALRWRGWERWWSYPVTFMAAMGLLAGFGGGGIGTRLTIASAGAGGAVWWFAVRRSRLSLARRRVVSVAGWLVIVALIAALMGLIWNTVRKSPQDHSWVNSAPVLGVADVHDLWVVRDDRLVRYDRTTWQVRDMEQRDVTLLAMDHGRVWALSAHSHFGPAYAGVSIGQIPGTLELVAYRGDTKDTVLKQPYDPGGWPIAMMIQEGRPLILTQNAIIRLLADGAWQTTPLSGNVNLHQMGGGGQVLARDDPRHLYVGNNGGEFIGGVNRNDLQTGVVEPIERRDGPGLCAGPLNRACDPILGMAQDPAHPDCVLATYAAPMSSTGGAILRLCGRRVEVAMQTPILPMTSLMLRLVEAVATWTGSPWSPRNQQFAEPVYAMDQTQGGVVWAVGENALYRADAKGIARKHPPVTDHHAGMWMGEVPGMILIDRWDPYDHRLGGIATLLVPIQP